MKRLSLLILSLSLIACASWQTAARTALDAAQIACALAPSLTTEEQIAKACQIEESLRPALRTLLAGKAGAARYASDAGVSTDAGGDR